MAIYTLGFLIYDFRLGDAFQSQIVNQQS